MIEALASEGPGTLKIPIVEAVKSRFNPKKKNDISRCKSGLLQEKLKRFVLQEETKCPSLKNSCWDKGFDSPQLRRKKHLTEKNPLDEKNEEKRMIMDLIQKTKYVFLSIFYQSHYNKVMNFMLPSSKKKLQILKGLDSNSSLSPVFRRIQRGDSPTRQRKLSNDFSYFYKNCNEEGEDNSFFNRDDEENENSFIVNEFLKELEKKERNIASKEGKKWILLKRNKFLAENEWFMDKRRELLDKYFVWKMKKWSNVAKKSLIFF